ncbi:hypothetical protein [Pedobacter sp. MR22-3]|uniref:hypothetical protein n=1 Tax=Pedobacter sp. MR22-3 TaxID=2994552 RepID=UPI00224723F8|nr:hypothetical protein [Pedobacter sp. MR22-3]MCX2584309.1 hypothetical protein [Pedobacter sp. MR22-3]
MSQIKSLAEQLKSKLGEQKGILTKPSGNLANEKRADKKTGKKSTPDTGAIVKFIESLQDFPMDGQEKILIRIDKRSMNILRGFKVASNVDMTRVIVFSLHEFLKSHPWLSDYISQTLNSMTHELD